MLVLLVLNLLALVGFLAAACMVAAGLSLARGSPISFFLKKDYIFI